MCSLVTGVQTCALPIYALVAGDEAEPFVEAPRVGPRLVGGQLYQAAATLPAAGDGPGEHRAPDAAAAIRSGNPHALDLASPLTQARQPGNEGELEIADHRAARRRAPERKSTRLNS